jgi:hypothetical protein
VLPLLLDWRGFAKNLAQTLHISLTLIPPGFHSIRIGILSIVDKTYGLTIDINMNRLTSRFQRRDDDLFSGLALCVKGN